MAKRAAVVVLAQSLASLDADILPISGLDAGTAARQAEGCDGNEPVSGLNFIIAGLVVHSEMLAGETTEVARCGIDGRGQSGIGHILDDLGGLGIDKIASIDAGIIVLLAGVGQDVTKILSSLDGPGREYEEKDQGGDPNGRCSTSMNAADAAENRGAGAHHRPMDQFAMREKVVLG